MINDSNKEKLHRFSLKCIFHYFMIDKDKRKKILRVVLLSLNNNIAMINGQTQPWTLDCVIYTVCVCVLWPVWPCVGKRHPISPTTNTAVHRVPWTHVTLLWSSPPILQLKCFQNILQDQCSLVGWKQ